MFTNETITTSEGGLPMVLDGIVAEVKEETSNGPPLVAMSNVEHRMHRF